MQNNRTNVRVCRGDFATLLSSHLPPQSLDQVSNKTKMEKRNELVFCNVAFKPLIL